MRGVLQEIVAQNFGSYRRSHHLSVRERRAAHCIRTCRTSAQGMHVRICPQGDYREYFYNSCKHRSCPRCGGWETERWVQAQETRLLPCPYYHIVLTLPEEFNVLWRYNRGAFENHLFHAAWSSIRNFFKNKKWVGGVPGALIVFQSWGETLNIHPHLHIVITAGGLSPKGKWFPARRDYLIPTQALTELFRGKFVAAVAAALLQQHTLIRPHGQSARHWHGILVQLGKKPWHAHIQPPRGSAMGLIRYLSFYIRGGPIAEERIGYKERNEVRIAYKRPDEHRQRYVTFTAREFLSRFLVHVPAKGQRMIRAYGLFHHRAQKKWEHARRALAESSVDEEQRRPGARVPPIGLGPSRPPGLRCPRCGCRLLVHRLAHQGQAPPREMAA